MTDKDIKQLTPLEQKVAAKVLSENGYSTRKIQKITGMDDVTAWRASQQATPEELKRFEADFTTWIQERKKIGVVAVHNRLLDLIPKERRIDQVVKAGEFLEGKGNQTLQQFNVAGGMELNLLNDDGHKITQGTSGSSK